jgi:hypothetical protein
MRYIKDNKIFKCSFIKLKFTNKNRMNIKDKKNKNKDYWGKIQENKNKLII